jgi:chromosome segregation ATPase
MWHNMKTLTRAKDLQLIKERDSLKTELKSKAGEISIVRSKQDKANKDHERELAYIRKHHEETLEKQRKDLEAARNAQKAAATERDFISRDLAEESERIRRLNKAKEAEKRNPIPTTPKKKQTLSHRDGFDDDEIEILSPSKISPLRFQLKRQQGSPSKPGKRKRKEVESPAGALPIVQYEVPSEVEQVVEEKVPALYEALLEKLSVRDDRFDVSLHNFCKGQKLIIFSSSSAIC